MLLLSALFGVGAALTLDEFALILHLDDVYWAKEGRGSIEATLMGFTFGLLCLLAAAPLGSDPGKDGIALPAPQLSGVLTAPRSSDLSALELTDVLSASSPTPGGSRPGRRRGMSRRWPRRPGTCQGRNP